MIKYTLMLLIAILMLDGLAMGGPITWIVFTEAAIAAWFSMLLATCLIPYVLYRRTSGEWVLPFTPLIKALALTVRPLVFALDLLESLMGGHDEEPGPGGARDLRREHRGAHHRRRRRRAHRGGRPQADPVGGRVRRHHRARSHDAAAEHRRHLGARVARRSAQAGHPRAVFPHSRSTKPPSTTSPVSCTCATCSSSTKTAAPTRPSTI